MIFFRLMLTLLLMPLLWPTAYTQEPQNIISALNVIAQKLEGKNITWVVYASCGLALQGMDIQPNDIDVLADKNDMLKINDILRDYEIEPLKSAFLETLASTMTATRVKFLINNCVVEVMGGFKIKSKVDNMLYDMDKKLENPDIIEVDDFKIPVLPLLRSLELYKLMGREKDISKIPKIERYITTVTGKKERGWRDYFCVYIL